MLINLESNFDFIEYCEKHSFSLKNFNSWYHIYNKLKLTQKSAELSSREEYILEL